MEKYMWLVYALLAGLAWGTYVPLIATGGKELAGNRFGAMLCVGIAYLLLAIVLPIVLFMTGREQWPNMNAYGLTFSTLAGVAGAVGALCVIFATRAAGGPKGEMTLYIAPMIFGLAPLINTLVSAVWHPAKDQPFVFHLEMPGWKMWAGIVFIGIGAAMVLYSKEETERAHAKPPAQMPATEVAQR